MFSEFSKQNIGRRIISSGLVAPLKTLPDMSVNLSLKGKLTGLGVSKGIFKGEVIIVREFDPKANVKGKILVTEHTDPGWTLLFLNAAAVIVEKGNALSHASIVSREIGIPAVVAVENACSKLKNKDNVIVNGGTGEIIIL
jgi:pyruvate,water dikinase